MGNKSIPKTLAGAIAEADMDAAIAEAIAALPAAPVFVDYYVEWDTGDEVDETTNSGINTIGLGGSADLAFSALTTPNAGLLSTCKQVKVDVEYYFSTDGKWHSADGINTDSNASAWGITAFTYDGNNIFVQAASQRLWWTQTKAGGSNADLTGSNVAQQARLHITAVKE